MINPIFVLRILIVVLVGIIVYRRTKDPVKALLGALGAFVVIWGISYAADLFME